MPPSDKDARCMDRDGRALFDCLAAQEGASVRTLIAFVPDPADPPFDYTFDWMLEAMRIALVDEGSARRRPTECTTPRSRTRSPSSRRASSARSRSGCSARPTRRGSHARSGLQHFQHCNDIAVGVAWAAEQIAIAYLDANALAQIAVS